MHSLSILVLLLLVFTVQCRIITHSSTSREIWLDSINDNDRLIDSSRHSNGKVTLYDQAESIDLDYDARIKDSSVALDKLSDVIDHIKCLDDSLIISLKSTNQSISQWSVGTLLNGGFRWHCQQHIGGHQRDAIIMRRITAIPQSIDQSINQTNKPYQLKIMTEDVSVMECFDSFELKMNLNHSETSIRHKEAIDQTNQSIDQNQSINPKHQFHPLQSGPSFNFRRVAPAGRLIDDNTDARLEWSASQWENPLASITVSLNRLTAINTPQLIQSWNASLAANGITLRLPSNLVGPNASYFSINYANAGVCPPLSVLGSCCLNRCRADDRDDGLFFVRGTRNATLRIPSDIIDWDCAKCASMNTSSLSVPPYACQLCSQGYNDLHVRGACTDCYLSYSYSAYQLDISLVGQRATLIVDVDAAVHADFYLDMQLGVQTGVRARSGGSLALGQWSASFLGVNFQLSFDLDFDVTHDASNSGPVNVTGGFDARVRFGGAVGHRNGRVLELPQGTIAHQPHALTVRSSGPVDFSFAVQPHLRFDLFTIFGADITCEIFGRVQSTHNIAPAYPALPAGTRWDDRSTRAINHTGDCTTPHLVRNLLSVGVRKNNIVVTFNVNILNVWELNYSFNSTNVGNLAADVPLLAHCDGPRDPLVIVPVNVTLYFDARRDLNFNDLGVVFALTLDVARSLHIHHSRVMLISATRVGRNVTAEFDIVEVVIRILPSTVNGPSEATPIVLVDALALQLRDVRSALRTSPTTSAIYVAALPADSSSTGSWTNVSSGITAPVDVVISSTARQPIVEDVNLNGGSTVQTGSLLIAAMIVSCAITMFG